LASSITYRSERLSARIAAALGGNDDLAGDLAPHLAALFVVAALLPLDVCPVTVAGHIKS